MYRKPQTITIYVLECAKGKYYVGRTHDPDDRVEQHYNGKGAVWTKVYPAIKEIVRYPHCDTFDEDKWTKFYMAKYGIENVRGGAYTKMELDGKVVEMLEKEIFNTEDKCFRCGRKGHFSSKCFVSLSNGDSNRLDPPRTPISKRLSKKKDKIESPLSKVEKPRKKILKIPEDKCSRCGRKGHRATTCYASTGLLEKV